MARPEHIENARRVFSDNLALFVGQGRRFSVEAVGAAAALSPDTIRAALRGHSCPDWANALALIDVLPAEFGAAVLRRRRHARAIEALGSYNTAARALADAKQRRDTRSIHRAELDLRAARTEMLRIGA